MAHARNPFAKPTAKPNPRNPFAKNGQPEKKGRSADEMAKAREAKARKRTEAEAAQLQSTRDSIPVMKKRLKEAGKNYDRQLKVANKAKTIEEINSEFAKLDSIQNEIINLGRRLREAERTVAAA